MSPKFEMGEAVPKLKKVFPEIKYLYEVIIKGPTLSHSIRPGNGEF